MQNISNGIIKRHNNDVTVLAHERSISNRKIVWVKAGTKLLLNGTMIIDRFQFRVRNIAVIATFTCGIKRYRVRRPRIVKIISRVADREIVSVTEFATRARKSYHLGRTSMYIVHCTYPSRYDVSRATCRACSCDRIYSVA